MNPTPTLPEIRQRTAGAYANMGVTLTTATGTQTAAIVEQLSGGPDHRGGSSKLAHALSAGVPPKITTSKNNFALSFYALAKLQL